MSRTSLLLTVIAMAALAKVSWAGDCCCPECGCKVCCAIEEEKTEKKHCYEVECKDICIPKFRFPWEMCCKPQCGRVKTVKVLKKVDYECKYCGYRWEINAVVDGCCGAANRDCAAGPHDTGETSSRRPRSVPVSNNRVYRARNVSPKPGQRTSQPGRNASASPTIGSRLQNLFAPTTQP